MMGEERPISGEQALLAVKAAGLDTDQPLSAQLQSDQNSDLEQQVADLSEQVGRLSESLGSTGQPAGPPPHERLAKQLSDAQSKWMTLGGGSDEAA
jgi:hypothetical protein